MRPAICQADNRLLLVPALHMNGRVQGIARPRTRDHALFLLMMLAVGAIGAGCEEERVGQLVVKGAFQPDTLDFGEVPVGMTKKMSTALKNLGVPVLEITNYEVPRPFTLPSIKASLLGERIAPGTPMNMDVGFVSMEEGEVKGTLKVMSGAMTAELKLRAVGVLVQVPVIVLEPMALDFGSVEVNTESKKMVTVRNEGNAPGVIERTTLANGGAYSIDPPAPFTVEPGQSVNVAVVFKPTTQGRQADVMSFHVRGLQDPVDLSLNGQGASALGEMLCTPSSVDFGRVERGSSQRRSVSCAARGGPVRLISATIAGGDGYFSLVSATSARDLQPSEAAEIALAYAPEGLPMAHRATLTVTYRGSNGQATVDVPLTGELIPPPPTVTAISVLLRWNSNNTDVDLHLVRPGAMPFGMDGGDCFYARKAPDWGVQGDLSDNPFLDVDDTNGFGPENINLTQTAPGVYRVMVHYFSDVFFGDSIATVEVYVGGMLAGTYNRTLSCDDLWEVGVVNWNGTSGTFNPTNTMTSRNGHGACLF